MQRGVSIYAHAVVCTTPSPPPCAAQVENGDLTWVVPGKLAAFSGPAASEGAYPGYRAAVPEDYVTYFRRRRVGAVVRLNKKARVGVSVGGGGGG